MVRPIEGRRSPADQRERRPRFRPFVADFLADFVARRARRWDWARAARGWGAFSYRASVIPVGSWKTANQPIPGISAVGIPNPAPEELIFLSAPSIAPHRMYSTSPE